MARGGFNFLCAAVSFGVAIGFGASGNLPGLAINVFCAMVNVALGMIARELTA